MFFNKPCSPFVAVLHLRITGYLYITWCHHHGYLLLYYFPHTSTITNVFLFVIIRHMLLQYDLQLTLFAALYAFIYPPISTPLNLVTTLQIYVPRSSKQPSVAPSPTNRYKRLQMLSYLTHAPLLPNISTILYTCLRFPSLHIFVPFLSTLLCAVH